MMVAVMTKGGGGVGGGGCRGSGAGAGRSGNQWEKDTSLPPALILEAGGLDGFQTLR